MDLESEEVLSGVNLFVQKLEETEIDPESEYFPTRMVIEDNVGESIHVHYRNIRLDFTIDDFLCFSGNIVSAMEEIEDG